MQYIERGVEERFVDIRSLYLLCAHDALMMRSIFAQHSLNIRSTFAQYFYPLPTARKGILQVKGLAFGC
jgi:hypothetical protein